MIFKKLFQRTVFGGGVDVGFKPFYNLMHFVHSDIVYALRFG